MAPIDDRTVQSLQDMVSKLESRVKELEDKISHAHSSGTPHEPSGNVRMILMGPPGAGKSSNTHRGTISCSSR